MDSSYRQAALTVLFSHAIVAAKNPDTSSTEGADITASVLKTFRSLMQQPDTNTDVRLEAAKFAFRLGAELKNGSEIQNYLLGYVGDRKNGFSVGYDLRDNARRDASRSTKK